MSYMQIATKHMSSSKGPLQTDQTDPKAPTKPMLNKKQVQPNKKAVAIASKSKTLPSTNSPVPGTPYAALAGLMKNK